jgi:hypothetical protein
MRRLPPGEYPAPPGRRASDTSRPPGPPQPLPPGQSSRIFRQGPPPPPGPPLQAQHIPQDYPTLLLSYR